MAKHRFWKRGLPWIIPLGCLALWQLVSMGRIVPAYLLPHPFDVCRAAYGYVFEQVGSQPFAGRFINDLLNSLLRVLFGFSLAVLAGIPLGLLSGRLPLINRLLSNMVSAMRAVPGISWLPLAMVWFGIGVKTTVFLVAMAAFFPIYLNSATGARQINPRYCQAGAMMGVGRWRTIVGILLPSAMPQILAGLRLGMGISWAYLVLGELTGVSDGMGAVIMDARMVGRIDIIIVGMLMIAVAGRLCDLLLYYGIRFCFRSARRMT
ncbi:binding-protein-dependent transport system inner membrane protein [Desulfosarcina ovata subsp. sediminis]|uniref:Binding-protein-dependent transport system inner membrane protein n=1 Tax=Desulfosarcina ovata subsp. sediminis TaxID=885957 RepID=A0A5K7ZI92_9BACT|nr:ABC transporter permease [Desulfosarcina ovata]BBO81084.1 binding-protein-dependent transport system inner membrane protein [Desulfosarcina ovata subsp. sediminis]